MLYRILLVDPDVEAIARLQRFLAEAGYRTACVSSFEDAARQVALDPPDLMVTAVRLGAFNGLHLVLRFRADSRDMPIVVAADLDDLVLQSDVTRYGARFITKPAERGSFLELVSELLDGRPARDPVGARRFPRKHAELPATVSDASVRVVELSYGGLRLELGGNPAGFDDAIDVDLPTLGLSVKAVPKWSKPTYSEGSWWCGVELSPADSKAARAWRGVVDSLN